MSNILSYNCRTKLDWLEIISPYHGNKSIRFFDDGVMVEQTNVSQLSKYLEDFYEYDEVYFDVLGYESSSPLVETNANGIISVVF